MIHSLSIQSSPRARQRGSVFLICLLLITVLTLTASSFSLASGSTLDVVRDEHSSLQAEFLAESGIAFALRQIVLDPEWAGTGGDSMQLGEAGSFSVENLGTGPGGGVLLRVTGVDGESQSTLQAEVDPGSGGPGSMIKSCGLVTYGGSIDINNIHVLTGNVLIVDDTDGVRDWSPSLEEWLQPPIADGTILANNVSVPGILYTYKSPLNGITAGGRVTVTAPVRTPRLNLDSFLVPNANTMIVTNPVLKNLTTTKTVVMNVPAGAFIDITKCNLKGGLVVYAESSYTPRSEPRNTIQWSNSKFGSETPTGVVAGLGIIAPAAAVTHSYQQTAGYGLFLVKSAEHLNAVTINKGAMMVLDYMDQTNNLDITYDESMWSDSLMGMLDFGVSETKLLSIQEYYPEQ